MLVLNWSMLYGLAMAENQLILILFIIVWLASSDLLFYLTVPHYLESPIIGRL